MSKKNKGGMTQSNEVEEPKVYEEPVTVSIEEDGEVFAPWQQRMFAERNELSNRLSKLNNYLQHEARHPIDTMNLDRIAKSTKDYTDQTFAYAQSLFAQQEAMQAYLEELDKQISMWN
jgi:hypothetical protein